MNALIDRTGQTFGRLVVVGRHAGGGRARWLCNCECGNASVVSADKLSTGHTTSCGCARVTVGRARTKHGQSKTGAEYRVWAGMIQRCTNPNNGCFANYGGRGIYVDEAWMSYETFVRDVGPRPPGKQLDRIDNDGPYAPGNVRWATPKENSNNRRVARRYRWRGRAYSLSELGREIGLTPSGIWRRLKLVGMSVEEAMSLPRRGVANDLG